MMFIIFMWLGTVFVISSGWSLIYVLLDVKSVSDFLAGYCRTGLNCECLLIESVFLHQSQYYYGMHVACNLDHLATQTPSWISDCRNLTSQFKPALLYNIVLVGWLGKFEMGLQASKLPLIFGGAPPHSTASCLSTGYETCCVCAGIHSGCSGHLRNGEASCF